MKRVGIVIPTLFTRPDYLILCLEAVKKAGTAEIVILGPKPPKELNYLLSEVDGFIEEPEGFGLAGKLDIALSSFSESVEYISWIGDDDLLTPNSLEITQGILDKNPEVVLVFGKCDYINAEGNKIGTNPSSWFAPRLMHFGPFLIPQPGSLWRRDAYLGCGGLNDSFKLAFDHDLFLRLHGYGKFRHTKQTLASFRWHADSLTVGNRKESVQEASRARVSRYSNFACLLSFFWEPLVRRVTESAGEWVSISSRKT